MSRWEKAALGAGAAFLLFSGGWFFAVRQSGSPYQVTTAQTTPREAGTAQTGSASEDEQRPDSLLEGEQIDVNTADLYDLQRLPGIGEKRAQAIVAYREEHGPFQSLEELTGVSGIGEGILEGLRDYATVGQG
jgi:competence protein ComEA